MKDGRSLRDHLESVERQTGQEHPELSGAPQLPPLLAYLWSDFSDLSEGRSQTGMGATTLSWTDIVSWQQIRDIQLTHWEIELIRRIDLLWVNAINTQETPSKGKK